MSANERPPVESLYERKTALEELKEQYDRIQSHLAIHQFDLQERGIQLGAARREQWYVRRARGKRQRKQKEKDRKADRDAQMDELERQIRAQKRAVGLSVTPSPTQSEFEAREEREAAALEAQIAQYQNRVRRKSIHLLVAAAAGEQYRDTTLATRDGKYIPKIDPAKPLYYRSFENRRTSSLTSTEATARKIKKWLNRERDIKMAGRPDEDFYVFDSSENSSDGPDPGPGYRPPKRRGPPPGSRRGRGPQNRPIDWSTDSESYAPSSDALGDDYSSNSSVHSSIDVPWASDSDDDGNIPPAAVRVARAMMAQAEAAPGTGDWVDKISRRLLEKYSKLSAQELNELDGKGLSLVFNQATQRRGNQPAGPDANLYDPRRWKPFQSADMSWVKAETQKFRQVQDLETSGWLTWDQMEKRAPELGKVLHLREVKPDELWDPDVRVVQEGAMASGERPRLGIDVITKLSLEKGRTPNSLEPYIWINEYDPVPMQLPDKLPKEYQTRGLPAPRKLPLMGPSGQVPAVETRQTATAKGPVGTDKPSKEDPVVVNDAVTAAAQFQYPLNTPTQSTFKFADGKSVADIFDTPVVGGPIRRTTELQELGKELVKREAKVRKPYMFDNQSTPTPFSTKLSFASLSERRGASLEPYPPRLSEAPRGKKRAASADNADQLSQGNAGKKPRNDNNTNNGGGGGNAGAKNENASIAKKAIAARNRLPHPRIRAILEDEEELQTEQSEVIEEYRAAVAETKRVRAKQEAVGTYPTQTPEYVRAWNQFHRARSELKQVLGEETSRRTAELAGEDSNLGDGGVVEDESSSKKGDAGAKFVRFAEPTSPNGTMLDEARRAVSRYEYSNDARRNLIRPFPYRG